MIRAFLQTIKIFDLKHKRFTVVYIVFAVIAAVSNMISIQAAGSMTQSAEMGIRNDMMVFLLILAVAGAIQALTDGLSTLLSRRAYGKALHSIREGFARRLANMPYRDFMSKNSGEGTSIFSNDVPMAAEHVTTKFFTQISQLITLAVSIAFMAYINWPLALVYFALFPPLALLQSRLSVPIGQKNMEASRRKAAFNDIVADALQNPLTIKTYELESIMEKRFDDSYMKYYDASYESSKTGARLALMGIGITFMPTFALFLAACAVVIGGDMTIAEFITLTIIAGPVGSWLMMFSQELARIRQTSASAVRVLEYLPEVAAKGPDSVRIHTSGDCAVVMENITFEYSDGVAVLDGATFFVEKGTITAIAGESGCGKSTALKLMLGLLSPNSGSITLSSAKITYVPQDCYLFPVSIRENILYGLPFDEERLRTALEDAGIYDFVNSLPKGLDTVLIESADNISGGQKQRIAMAWAFYRDADILLLDEATSSLDPSTEQSVLETFCHYIKSNSKTAVIVAHRQSVLDISDRVITLAKGGVQI